MIGRRPYAAFGNSTGDRQMLEYKAGDGSRLAMLVLHDDAKREYAYDPAQGLPNTKVGTFTQKLYDEAKKQDRHQHEERLEAYFRLRELTRFYDVHFVEVSQRRFCRMVFKHIWDYFTFATIFVLVVAGVALVVFLMGLPGRIVIAPQAPGCRSIGPRENCDRMMLSALPG
jgi:hypothetical protein